MQADGSMKLPAVYKVASIGVFAPSFIVFHSAIDVNG